MIRKLLCKILYLHDFHRCSHTSFTHTGIGNINPAPYIYKEWLKCSTCGYIYKIK